MWSTALREISRTREYRRELFKDCVLCPPIQEVGGTNLDSLAIASECLNGNEAFSPDVRQGPQQDRIDDAEYCRTRANADRERNHNDRREPGMLEQTPHSVANVFEECFHNFLVVARILLGSLLSALLVPQRH